MSSPIIDITSDTSSPAKARADVLVVGLTSGKDDPQVVGAGELPKAVRSELESAAKAVGFSGAADGSVRLPGIKGLSASSVILAGLGSFDELDLISEAQADAAHEVLRRAAGSAIRSLSKGETVALALPTGTTEAAEAVATGAVLGAYLYAEYLSEPGKRKPVGSITVLTDSKSAPGVDRGAHIAAAANRARDLVNQPPLDLYPETFAQAVADQAKGRKVKVTVLDDAALESQGYGGLTGVGKGSPRGPRLVKLEYSPRRAGRHLALVGKGITFDSGGLSLKPAASMEDMKSDMAGAAAAAQSLFAIADLGLPVKVTAWLALAENMPGGNAQRPSDVIRIFGGKTVEVTNTDAEGRLVLADALVAAQQDGPDLLIDIATLTGAQVIALGNRVSGVMGTNGARNRVVLAAGVSGEQMWPMPFPEEIRSQFDSTVADLKNSGKRAGGMLAAGIFLKEFVSDDVEWAHIDIAGPSYNTESPWGYTPKAATGVPVRTLVEVAAQLAGG
ncbi:leucyl aminopeptidase [Brevibacterium daeguense]|uniref:Probable cytosol aminopeptidase n=1 Tax=Brevibacterium daeguense TaxID=909936 RepID=A0ABP8EPI0_9MICO|nr:leucyl aminopeptidase [Brevibacterium daeguense]